MGKYIKDIERPCENCGKLYMASSARLKFNKDRFCSRKCSYEFRGNNLYKKEKHVELECFNCGKPISRYSNGLHERNYCNSECRLQARVSGKFKAKPRKKKDKNSPEAIAKRKYYKYRLFDKSLDDLIDYTVREFVDVVLTGKCYYCGFTENLGLDRMDNTKGHTKNNTVICCQLCNMTRGDRFTVEEFKKTGAVINEIRKGK